MIGAGKCPSAVGLPTRTRVGSFSGILYDAVARRTASAAMQASRGRVGLAKSSLQARAALRRRTAPSLRDRFAGVPGGTEAARGPGGAAASGRGRRRRAARAAAAGAGPGPLRARGPVLVRGAVRAATPAALAHPHPGHPRHAPGPAPPVPRRHGGRQQAALAHRTAAGRGGARDPRPASGAGEPPVGAPEDPGRAGPRRGHLVAAWTVRGNPSRRGHRPGPAPLRPPGASFSPPRPKGIIACDFLPSDTVLGSRWYAPVFGEHGARRLPVTGVIAHSAQAWAVPQARHLAADLTKPDSNHPLMPGNGPTPPCTTSTPAECCGPRSSAA
ncbi:hypothetical protein ACVW19_006254 [Streptomyces sp. TE5632]